MTTGIVFAYLTGYSIIMIIFLNIQGQYEITCYYITALILSGILSIEFVIGGIIILPTRESLILHGLSIAFIFVLQFVLIPYYDQYLLVLMVGIRGSLHHFFMLF